MILTIKIHLSSTELQELYHGKIIEKEYHPELSNDYYPIIIEIGKKSKAQNSKLKEK